MVNSQGKKVTLATIKSFVKREKAINNLYIKTRTRFDGMVDCVTATNDENFDLVKETEINHPKNNLGIAGAWLVGNSRDYFNAYSDENFIGYVISNCCGTFILAMKRLY